MTLRDPAARDRVVRELTLRGLVLGALITVVFTASNIYLGLKIGLTFASSIPAAVISMAALRPFNAGILENNMVQTQASAAGTLSSVIFVLPALVIGGIWSGFPFWSCFAICAAGGGLGVLFTIPLRRVLVRDSALPYPEGTAAAAVLQAGSADATDAGRGLRALLGGGIVSGLFALCSGGLGLLADGAGITLSAGSAVFKLSTGFSLALVGAGYLVGIGGGLAMLLGAVLCWGVAVPALTALSPHPAGVSAADFATGLWAHKARFIGAGTIAVAAVWTLANLLGPVTRGLASALRGEPAGTGTGDPGTNADGRTERDLPPRIILGLGLVLLAVLLLSFAAFSVSGGAALSAALGLGLVCAVFCLLFGFLVAAACGYMAGIVGSSSSPISGIAIVAVSLVSVMLLLLGALDLLPASFEAAARGPLIGLALFVTSAVLSAATISNDNLQDLKTGLLVGATPWRQQVALLFGVLAGAAVIAPTLTLLYHAYGFPGALPRPDMDPNAALAAPQAVLLATLARGIVLHQLDWTMIGIGAALGIVLVAFDVVLRRTGRTLPVLAVGIGLYLPPTVSVTLVIGAFLGFGIDRALARRDGRAATPGSATPGGAHPVAETSRRFGVMLASGLIVGESLMGVVLAAVIGATGHADALAVVGPGFAGTAVLLGFVAFVLVCAGFARTVLRPAPG